MAAIRSILTQQHPGCCGLQPRASLVPAPARVADDTRPGVDSEEVPEDVGRPLLVNLLDQLTQLPQTSRGVREGLPVRLHRLRQQPLRHWPMGCAVEQKSGDALVHRWTTLVIAAHAFLAAATTTNTTTLGSLIPITVNELRRLFHALIIEPTRRVADVIAWSIFRRRHQAQPRAATTPDKPSQDRKTDLLLEY